MYFSPKIMETCNQKNIKNHIKHIFITCLIDILCNYMHEYTRITFLSMLWNTSKRFAVDSLICPSPFPGLIDKRGDWELHQPALFLGQRGGHLFGGRGVPCPPPGGRGSQHAPHPSPPPIPTTTHQRDISLSMYKSTSFNFVKFCPLLFFSVSGPLTQSNLPNLE